jgi:hypothetical protein
VALTGDPGEVLAAIPHILGFHPTDSLVVLCLRGDPASATLATALRCDLVPAHQHTAFADQVADAAARQHADCVFLALVCPPGSTADPPERELITTVIRELASSNVVLIHAVWTAATRHGQRWRCYDEPDYAGTLSDPDASPVAATLAFTGRRIYPSRADLAHDLDPDDDATAARRAVLLADQALHLGPVDARRAARIVHGAITRTAEGDPPRTDGQVILLALLLSDPRVTEQCLALCAGPNAEAAEQLWRVLTRALPAPHRAQPAILLAVTVYLRGEGALAHVALDAAEKAAPGYPMANLLRRAFQIGIAPTELAELIAGALTSPNTNET